MPQIECFPLAGMSFGDGVKILIGSGNPGASTLAAVSSAAVGSLFLRTDGAVSSVLYVKESLGTNADGNASAGTWSAK
jgi:hypothetical protein